MPGAISSTLLVAFSVKKKGGISEDLCRAAHDAVPRDSISPKCYFGQITRPCGVQMTCSDLSQSL